ncbi:MAG: hypothetical protein J6U23_01530 [Clostridiales bacterium]|nr:hypothetical protein [Clostridiales bacterium]
MIEDRRPKTNTDIYIMAKIFSVILCFILFWVFFYAKKFVFVSDYDLLAKRVIFRNPSELKNSYTAGSFWTYFNRGLAFFFAAGGLVHIFTATWRFISQKTRALLEVIISVMLTISLPIYFPMACIISKSRIKFSGIIIVFIIFFVLEVLMTLFYAKRYKTDKENFSIPNRTVSLIVGIILIIITLLPLCSGVKAISLAMHYYQKNPYSIFDQSDILEPNEVGNYLNRSAVYGDDVYMRSARSVFKIDKEQNVSEVFKFDTDLQYLLVYDDKIFYVESQIISTDVRCYDLKTGENTLIFSNDETNDTIRLFYIKNGKLYFSCNNSELYCLDTKDIHSKPAVVFHDMLDRENLQYYNYYGLSFDELRNRGPYSTQNMILYKGSLYERDYVPKNSSEIENYSSNVLNVWTRTEEDEYYSKDMIIEHMDDFNIYDDVIYYTNFRWVDGLGELYQADLNGENAKLIAKYGDASYSIAVTENLIYVCLSDDIYVLKR